MGHAKVIRKKLDALIYISRARVLSGRHRQGKGKLSGGCSHAAAQGIAWVMWLLGGSFLALICCATEKVDSVTALHNHLN